MVRFQVGGLSALACCILFFSILDFSNGETVTLYNQTFQYGDFLLVNVKGCTNVPKRFRNAASAVDLHGGCLVFFDELNCKGRRVVLQPHHKKYTDNLKSIGFNNAVRSVLPCGRKIQSGTHVIRSAMDGSVLTVSPVKSEFFAESLMRPWARKENQLWRINKYGPRIGINYDMRPVSYPFYNPVTYQNFEIPRKDKEGVPYMPVRFYEFRPLPGGKYNIRILHTEKCLVNKGMGRPVGKANCTPWLANQQWQFIQIDPLQPSGKPEFGGPKSGIASHVPGTFKIGPQPDKPKVHYPLPVFL